MRGLHDRRSEADPEDRLPKAAIAAQHGIATVGPGLVLGNDAIELLEERRRRFDMGPRRPEDDNAEDALSGAIAGAEGAFGPHLRRYQSLAKSSVEALGSRRTVALRILNRNTLIAAGHVMVAFAASGVVGGAAWDTAKWIALNHDAVLAAAATYGETFLLWMRPIVASAQHLVAIAISTGMVPPPGTRPIP
jgi:hypothetical protein